MKNCRRYRQIDYSGLLAALVASCIFHGLLFFILSTTTIYYPMTSDREKIAFDFIWATLGAEADNLPTPMPSLPESITTVSKAEKPEQIAAAEHSDADKYESDDTDMLSDMDAFALTTVPPPPPPSSKAVPLKKPVIQKITAKQANIDANKEAQTGTLPETIPPVKVAEKPAPVETPKEVDNQQKSDLENATAKQEQAERERTAAELVKNLRIQEEKEAAVRQKAEQEQRAAELARNAELERQASAEATRKREVAENARKKKLAQEKARLERLNKMKREEEQRAREKLARDRLSAAKIEQERHALSRENNSLISAKENNPGGSAPESAAPKNNPSEPVLVKSVTTDGKQAPVKASRPEGITLPPIKGDIKVIVQSESDVIIKINFINYPRTKHKKPITKAEARELNKLTPVIVRNANNSIEAVIEHATDGIYVVQLEPKGDKSIDADISLKVLDSTIKSIGKRKVSGQTEVVRLLMPEGVLWSDDNAFTGNIEDSESITKFNSDTGLIWKEYRK